MTVHLGLPEWPHASRESAFSCEARRTRGRVSVGHMVRALAISGKNGKIGLYIKARMDGLDDIWIRPAGACCPGV